jgi:succinate dehydrogenase / fumarate reductase cytochrome b subunit
MQPMLLIRSSVGRKLLMAVSGLLLVGFVVAHLLGNITIFLGPNGINAYAVHLRSLGPLLWVFRIGLLIAFAVHVGFGIWLTLENRAARPVAYARKKTLRVTLAGETMIYTGLALASFIIYHLLHFTFHVTNPDISHFIDAAGRADIFRMVVLSFRKTYIVLPYLAGMAALLLHTSHGIGSLFQTLGANNDQTLPLLGRASLAAGLLLALCFSSIPVFIFFGFVTI